MAKVEAEMLTDLVTQLTEVVGADNDDDPAMRRLSPDVYPDDPSAANEFRRLTQADLNDRRAADAGRVLAGLTGTPQEGAQGDSVDVALSNEDVNAWMRTLAALRLVVASRLGVDEEDDRDKDDPRFGIYDWLAYRLEALIEATDPYGA